MNPRLKNRPVAWWVCYYILFPIMITTLIVGLTLNFLHYGAMKFMRTLTTFMDLD